MAVPGDATRWLLAIGSSTARRHLTFPHQLVGEAGSLWHDGVGYALMVTSGVTDGIRWNRDEYANRLAALPDSLNDNQTAGAFGLTELADIEPPRG